MCNRDCPDACGIVATVEAGRVTRLRGDPAHPITGGFLCYRTNRFLERQYAPERLTAPLVRRGGALVEATWEEALDLVASTLLRVRSASGGAAILAYRSGGSLGLVKHLTEHFWESFGPVTVKSGDICSGAGDDAQLTDFGDEDSHDLLDLNNSHGIVLWGKNVHASSVHLVPILRAARGRGARVVLIDPVRHRGTELADAYVQPRPGGDPALALAVARALFDAGRARLDGCDHGEAFKALCCSRTVEEWAAVAGVTGDEAALVAATLADGPTNIQVGWGLGRRRNGSAAVRLIDALGAISGNLGVPGGGVSFYYKRRGAFDTSFIHSSPPRRLPEALLGEAILAARDPEVRVAFITAANPVAMLPDSETVAHALRTRELTVVVDAFLTDTARCAHVVLPTTTMLEDTDLVGAYGHHWIGAVEPVVAPPPGVLTDYEIIQALARRTGVAGFDEPVDSWRRRLLSRVESHGVTLERLQRGAVRSPLAPTVLFDGGVATESGRVNLIHAVDPTPPAVTAERPMLLMALSTDRAQASQWPAHTQDSPPVARVHPDNAVVPHGAQAWLESEVGRMAVVVHHDPGQRRDVAIVPKGGWHHRGRSANALIRGELTDAGGGAAYYDTPVRILPMDARDSGTSGATI